MANFRAISVEPNIFLVFPNSRIQEMNIERLINLRDNSNNFERLKNDFKNHDLKKGLIFPTKRKTGIAPREFGDVGVIGWLQPKSHQ